MKTLLIADDESFMRDLLQEALKTNYNLLIAENGLEALTLYKKNPQIDLVITDIKMPGMSGVSLIETIKYINPNVKALFISGHCSDEEKKRLYPYPCITKPFRMAEIRDLIQGIFS